MKAWIFAALPVLAAATYGVDISASLDSNTANCFVQQAGVSFAIVRAWLSYGGFDSNAPGSVANLWNAGAAHVDVYMFPCAGQDAGSQVSSMLSSLSGTQFGMVWLDIETNPSGGCGWSGDLGSNCNYIASLGSALSNAGVNWGTYASEYMWSIIPGSGCTSGGSNPLWYADYDGNPSFSGFGGFGGWSTPAMKQYQGDDTVCGFSVDDNYYP